MNEPVPEPSHAQVLRILERDYPAEDRAAILEMLGEYGGESWHGEVDRVRLAILKLADGDSAKITECVEMARRDYRDVLAWAEYPNAMKLGFPTGPEAQELDRRARDADWDQYRAWLTR